MSPEELVRAVHRDLEKTITYYDSSLCGQSNLDPSWALFRTIYCQLSNEERSLFWQVIRGMQSDAVCQVFSLLDNQTYTPSQTEDLVTLHGTKRINGDLTDLYLGMQGNDWRED